MFCTCENSKIGQNSWIHKKTVQKKFLIYPKKDYIYCRIVEVKKNYYRIKKSIKLRSHHNKILPNKNWPVISLSSQTKRW